MQNVTSSSNPTILVPYLLLPLLPRFFELKFKIDSIDRSCLMQRGHCDKMRVQQIAPLPKCFPLGRQVGLYERRMSDR